MRTAIRKHLGDFVAIIALVAIATGVGGYILSQQRLRFPLVEEKPLQLKVELKDAQAVIPGQGQTVRVAGVKVGDIADVELEEGIAVVSVDIDPEHSKLVRRDATALLRPKTGLKDMFIELDPGSKDEEPISEGGRVPVVNTAPDIDPDEFLSALDRDTRDYLKLLISGAGKGLEGRGGDLREAFARLGPLHRDLGRLSKAIAERRSSLRRLVHNYSALTNELADKDGELTRLVTASNDAFQALAPVEQDISATVAKLPAALQQTSRTLVKVEDLGKVLGPALEDLRPAFRKLDEANKALRPFGRQATPAVKSRIRPFVREARPYVDELRPAAKGLNAATPDLVTSFFELNRFFNMAAYNEGGAQELTTAQAHNEGYLFWVAWVAQATTSIFNTSDGVGAMRRGQFTVSCDTVRDSLVGESGGALEPLLQLTPILNDPALCGTSAP